MSTITKFSSNRGNNPGQVTLEDIASMAGGVPVISDHMNMPCINMHDGEGVTTKSAMQAKFSIVAVDFDDGKNDKQAIIDKFKALDLKMFAFTSSGHMTPVNKNNKPQEIIEKWKVLIPLASPLSFDKFKKLSKAMTAYFKADKAQTSPAQLIYLPAILKKDNPFLYINTLDDPSLKELSLADAMNGSTRQGRALKALMQAEVAAEVKQIKERTAEAATRPVKPFAHDPKDGDVVTLIKGIENIRSVVGRNGYAGSSKPNVYASPSSESGVAGVHIVHLPDGTEAAYSYHGESDKLSRLHFPNGDAYYSVDVVQAVCILEHGGDFGAMIKHYAEAYDENNIVRRRIFAKARDAKLLADAWVLHEDKDTEAFKLAARITDLLDRACKLGSYPTVPEVNIINLSKSLERSFWNAPQGKLFVLDMFDRLSSAAYADATRHLAAHFGAIVDPEALRAAKSSAADGLQEQKGRLKEVNALFAEANTLVAQHIRAFRQRDSIHVEQDMFMDHGHVTLEQVNAKIVFPYTPLSVPANTTIKEFDPEVIAAYKEHFPKLDEFLTLMVMARLSRNRKQAYLWLHMPSDWGKGFLVSVLKNLSLVNTISEEQVEKIFEGGAVAKGAFDFLYSWVTFFDEFSKVKSELKRLEDGFSVSQKYALNAEVEVYLKLFASANDIPALVGENGTEAQFANRFSYWAMMGEIDNTEMFKKLGGARYIEHITLYAAQYLNQLMGSMRVKNSLDAATEAQDWLAKFNKAYSLGLRAGIVNESLEDIADSVIDWVHTELRKSANIQHEYKAGFDTDLVHFDGLTYQTGQKVYLQAATKVVGEFIKKAFSKSEGGQYYKMASEIARHMSVDNAPAEGRRFNNNRTKRRTIELKPVEKMVYASKWTDDDDFSEIM